MAAWWKMPSAPGKESQLAPPVLELRSHGTSFLPVLPLLPFGQSCLHQEVEIGDAPLDKRHPGVIQEVLDVFPPPGGEVVDDDDVVVLC
jgi:hypothetical protein